MLDVDYLNIGCHGRNVQFNIKFVEIRVEKNVEIHKIN